MAIYKTIYGTTKNKYIDCAIDVKIVEQNVEYNYSKINAELYYRKSSSSTEGTRGSYSGTLYAGNSSTSISGNFSIPRNDVWQYFGSINNVTIYHDNNGEATFSVSATGGMPATTFTETYISGSVSLPTIPRKAIVNSAQNFTDVVDGISPKINISNKAGLPVLPYLNIYVNGSVLVYEGTHTIERSRSVRDGDIAFALTETEMAYIRSHTTNAKSFDVTEGVDTYTSGGTLLDYSSLVMKFSYSETNSAPTISSVTIAPDNSGWTSDPTYNNVYVKGKSKVSITITASPKKSATITKYQASITRSETITLSGSSNTLVSGVINESGTFNILVSVTDSRGFVTTYNTQTITVLDYFVPYVSKIAGKSEIECFRCTAQGVRDNSGTYVYVSAKKVFADVSGTNTCTLKFRYKASGGSYSSWITLNTDDETNEYSGVINSLVSSGFSFLTDQSYSVEIGVSDSFNSSYSIQKNIPTDDVPLSLGAGGKSVGVGMYADETDENSLNVGYHTNFHDDVKFKEGISKEDVNGNEVFGVDDNGVHGCNIQCGYIQNVSDTFYTVVFAKPFKTKPIIVATYNIQQGFQNYHLSSLIVSDPIKNGDKYIGFDIRSTGTNTYNPSVNWIAIAP